MASKKTPALRAVESEEGNTTPLIDEGIGLPVEVGNPDAADEFAINQSHLEEYTTEEEGPPELDFGKPPKGTYFTTFKETTKEWKNRAICFVLELPNREPYLVAPNIAKKMMRDEDCIRPMLLVRYTTMDETEGLWPLKLDMPDRKPNKYNTTARQILAIADSGKWVRIVSGRGRYERKISPETFEETPPVFSDRTFKELRDSLFEDRQITTLDHEIWDELRGKRR